MSNSGALKGQFLSATPTTSNPVAPAAYGTVPEMSISITPRGGKVIANAQLGMFGDGTVRVLGLAISVGGAAEIGARRIDCSSVVHVTQAAIVNFVVPGLTPGTPVTITLRWVCAAGTITNNLTERVFTLEEKPYP